VERVAFVVERTSERISCMLNPESVVLRRLAGVTQRRLAGGLVTGAELADDPLFFTGGGTTELTLNLLFDVDLAQGSTIESPQDVRVLTGPLWSLSENARSGPEQGGPIAVRFVWGKAMNVRGIITAVAERLERFTIEGVPQRSWLRMRMLRVAESEADLEGGALPPPPLPDLTEAPPELPNGPTLMHAIAGDAAPPDEEVGEEGGSSERLDLLAHQYYGDPSQWRMLAWLNDIADPLRLEAGHLQHLPAADDFEVEP